MSDGIVNSSVQCVGTVCDAHSVLSFTRNKRLRRRSPQVVRSAHCWWPIRTAAGKKELCQAATHALCRGGNWKKRMCRARYTVRARHLTSADHGRRPPRVPRSPTKFGQFSAMRRGEISGLWDSAEIAARGRRAIRRDCRSGVPHWSRLTVERLKYGWGNYRHLMINYEVW